MTDHGTIQTRGKPDEKVPRYVLAAALIRAIARYPDEPLSSIASKLPKGAAERILREAADVLEREEAP